jgi:hypothetical protein
VPVRGSRSIVGAAISPMSPCPHHRTIEKRQPPRRRFRLVAPGELSRGLPLGMVADWKQKQGSATTEPMRWLGLRGCRSVRVGRTALVARSPPGRADDGK